jgi:hypothetical protein
LKSQDELLESLETELGLPRGFCFHLRHEDDWSFVVKLHALIESAASDFITRALGRKELADIFSRIEMSKPQTGKVAFIRALNLLPVGHTKFIEKLSQIRNQLAHKIGNAGFTFGQYLQHERQRLSEKQFAALGDRWAFGFVIAGQDYEHEPLAHHVMRIQPKSETPEGLKLQRVYVLLAQPRLAILWSALAILEAMSLCNLFGPQMWTFLMKCDDPKECEDWVHQLFDRAKVEDVDLPEKMAQKFERLPGVRIERDTDGQPILESLAAGFYLWKQKLLEEL